MLADYIHDGFPCWYDLRPSSSWSMAQRWGLQRSRRAWISGPEIPGTWPLRFRSAHPHVLSGRKEAVGPDLYLGTKFDTKCRQINEFKWWKYVNIRVNKIFYCKCWTSTAKSAIHCSWSSWDSCTSSDFEDEWSKGSNPIKLCSFTWFVWFCLSPKECQVLSLPWLWRPWGSAGGHSWSLEVPRSD